MDLKEQILRQMLHREVELARQLEARGKATEAALHFARAGGIYRRIAKTKGFEEAQELYSMASQYENVSKGIREVKTASKVSDVAPGALESAISGMVVWEKPKVDWNDIGGLGEAKRTIKESVILPFIKNKPGFVSAPKALLLYGPPGTGKTLLAKASCATLQATFFEARIPNMLSKYYGESNKLVAALFSKARESQPSLVFIDELDALAQSREGDLNEATRRVLGQLLTEMDGFASDADVLIMGATNKPWNLDDAILSRFQRKIYIPLPDADARKAIIKIHLKGAESKVPADELAGKSEMFSGRDLRNLCQEAIMHMVRERNSGLEQLDAKLLEHYQLKHRPLERKDFDFAFSKVKPSTPKSYLQKYEKWANDFGG
ncbi:MAG: AAA ATPase central domain protein [Candidatus Peregrinibacteria bacterium GW2011_GWA2_43_8]|nr:MAG: AAA ATPase central domain protein [Candidatus Peregrinibacteria bacterium GW2011_GWA2_43_8]